MKYQSQTQGSAARAHETRASGAQSPLARPRVSQTAPGRASCPTPFDPGERERWRRAVPLLRPVLVLVLGLLLLLGLGFAR